MPRQKGSTNKNQDIKRRHNESVKSIKIEAAEHLVKEAYARKIREEGKRPNISEIAEEVNLSQRKVSEILKEVRFDPPNSEYRVLTDKVIESVYKSAEAGNSGAQKLWFEIMEGLNTRGGENKQLQSGESEDGKRDPEEEEKLQERFKKELLGKLNVLEVIIARVAFKRGVPVHYILNQLKESWYANSTVLQSKKDGELEDDYFPSDEIYNFDEIKEKAEEKINNDKESKEQSTVEISDEDKKKAKTQREKILEKLAKGKKNGN